MRLLSCGNPIGRSDLKRVANPSEDLMASETDRKWRMITGCILNEGIVDVEHFTDDLSDIQALIDFGPDEDKVIDIRISQNQKNRNKPCKRQV